VPLGPPLQRLLARAAAAGASAVRRREAPGSELGGRGDRRGQRHRGVGGGPWGTGHHDKGLLSGSGLVATGVERWELTLVGWELASAEALNSHLVSGRGDGGDGAVPFLPERFLLAEAGDYAKGLQR